MRLSRGVFRQRRIGWTCAVAAGALMVSPLTAAARPEQHSSRATIAAAGGTVYGGVTEQGFPVVIEPSGNGRKVKAIIAIYLTCTSGAGFTLPDGYVALPVNKKRRFGASFGPMTTRNDDGTTTDFEGGISGAFNKARTKASGKWSLKATTHDASGAVVDTCDSGSVSWTAKQ